MNGVLLRNGHVGRGSLGTRTETGHCSACGNGAFSYNNGNEWSACGHRGYRCCACGVIKPERIKVAPAYSKPVSS